MPSWEVNFNIHVNTNNQEIVSLCAKADALASVINQIPMTPGRQRKINRLNILRAVRGTTGIEGANLTPEEVGLIIDAPSDRHVLPSNRRREEQEARNAGELMKYVAKLVDIVPNCQITENLIRKLHEITTQKIDYPNNVSGEYRKFPVHAGDYWPPREEEEVRILMRQFIDWFNTNEPTDWHPIIRAIAAHFYVVSIHPFGDGNGRTSRAVESFLLYKAGINARGFYSLANFYYQRRAEYVEQLTLVRFHTNGDLSPFILFALRGLISELVEVHREVLEEIRQIAFRDFAREVLYKGGASKPVERMLNFVLRLENRTVPLRVIRQGEHDLSSLYQGFSPKTLERDINYLRKHELIKVENGAIRANIEVMGIYTAPRELMTS